MLPNPLEARGPDKNRGPDEGATSAACTEPLSDSVTAVQQLYTHLCQSKNLPVVTQLGVISTRLFEHWQLVMLDFEHCATKSFLCVLSVVDGPEGETLVEKALHKEAMKAILNGAAVFFPDKHVRRDKLFDMMVSSFIHSLIQKKSIKSL